MPHHYEFYYFIANRTRGPNGVLFDYSGGVELGVGAASGKGGEGGEGGEGGGKGEREEEDEGGRRLREDPTLTKVVDRRWYERNKHIYPASVWTEFDPNADYRNVVKRDLGGNAFFFG